MRYYVMEPSNTVSLPAVPKNENAKLVFTTDLGRFSDVDYDPRNKLISNGFKLLMEQYLLDYDFMPITYCDLNKGDQMTFWRFEPDHYSDFNASYKNDGTVSNINTFSDSNTPIAFTAKSPKGILSVLVRMAVVESALRRCILGLKFTKVNDC
jgi:hypothetical protein